MGFDLDFYKGKRVFVTGHTGFKGSWLSVILADAGAKVIGYSSCSKDDTRLFDLCDVKGQIVHIKGDVRDLAHLQSAMQGNKPEIVIHMAAQPLVRESYQDPVLTYETNVMGTVNVLEATRHTPSVRSFLNVTTDKVYDNKERDEGYREDEPLDGYDPYSNSKSCSELVTHSFKKSFFADGEVAISTARAGNVIGGGDFAKDRIIPDCIRAAINGQDILVRNPYSIRPYQHVLEPLFAYLMIVAKQYEDPTLASWYNVGPDEVECKHTGELVDMFVREWGDGLRWINKSDNGPHESTFLKLDCSKIKDRIGWKPMWSTETAIRKVVDWSKVWMSGGDVRKLMDEQIREYMDCWR